MFRRLQGLGEVEEKSDEGRLHHHVEYLAGKRESLFFSASGNFYVYVMLS